jgi:hypothetical protein
MKYVPFCEALFILTIVFKPTWGAIVPVRDNTSALYDERAHLAALAIG